MEEEQDAQEVHETPEEVNSETTTEGETTPETELTAEEIAELKRQADASSQNFERAKKAEAKLKKLEGERKDDTEGLSQKDVLYLAKANIHEDDMDEVVEWAKFKKVSVKDAHEQLKATLEVREEQRKTAQATQVRGGQRGNSKNTGEDLLRQAETSGKLPDDEADIKRMVEARIARIKNK